MFKKLRGSFLLGIGYMLSPLSWWNDLFFNLPIALLFGYLVSWVFDDVQSPVIDKFNWGCFPRSVNRFLICALSQFITHPSRCTLGLRKPRYIYQRVTGSLSAKPYYYSRNTYPTLRTV